MVKGGDVKDKPAPITPLEAWAARFPYTPPPPKKQGPVSKSPDGAPLYGKQPYYGPSLGKKYGRD